MKGIEALQAMKEGKIVKTKYGRLYRMDDDIVQYNDGGEWESTEIELNVWINRDYELSSEPEEYKLSFFEAMVEAEKGHKVRTESYEVPYHMKRGILYNEDGCAASIFGFEMEAKWRVVKEEEE